MDDRAAVEDEIRCDSVPEYMRGELLIDLGEFPVPGKESPHVIPVQPVVWLFRHKDRLVVVLPPLHISY